VIHGDADPLVRLDGGHDTHQALRGSKLLVLEGMGHDLPEPLWSEVIDAIDALTQEAHSR
jgi:pimeloyl-ACP methyl ester carboxylesterase